MTKPHTPAHTDTDFDDDESLIDPFSQVQNDLLQESPFPVITTGGQPPQSVNLTAEDPESTGEWAAYDAGAPVVHTGEPPLRALPQRNADDDLDAWTARAWAEMGDELDAPVSAAQALETPPPADCHEAELQNPFETVDDFAPSSPALADRAILPDPDEWDAPVLPVATQKSPVVAVPEAVAADEEPLAAYEHPEYPHEPAEDFSVLLGTETISLPDMQSPLDLSGTTEAAIPETGRTKAPWLLIGASSAGVAALLGLAGIFLLGGAKPAAHPAAAGLAEVPRPPALPKPLPHPATPSATATLLPKTPPDGQQTTVPPKGRVSPVISAAAPRAETPRKAAQAIHHYRRWHHAWHAHTQLRKQGPVERTPASPPRAAPAPSVSPAQPPQAPIVTPAHPAAPAGYDPIF